jgi:hypothetical protein
MNAFQLVLRKELKLNTAMLTFNFPCSLQLTNPAGFWVRPCTSVVNRYGGAYSDGAIRRTSQGGAQ